jgi:uncharacterized membrane protein YhiD involved in acid resistance
MLDILDLAIQPAELAQQVMNDTVPELAAQFHKLNAAFVALPIATALGAALAFRPRRRGTPPRSAAVIQTQIILSIVGALVMLIVGASLARAFGIVGAASLIRYRAKIDDPKDAGVMLSTLAIGLASGVGLYLLAIFATVFMLFVLMWIESLEPRAHRSFTLTVKGSEQEQLKPTLERALRRRNGTFDLRREGTDVLEYEVQLPLDVRTEELSDEILSIGSPHRVAVEWDEHKKRK